MHDLYLIAINLTRRCNLACEHCYMDADGRASAAGELGTAEVTQLLDEIAARGTETMVVLTGGEPLLRRDLERLVSHGSQLGLAMVVGTNGVLLNESRVVSLKRAGVMGIGISLDSLEPDSHDRFRGCNGSWEKTLAGMDFCRRHQLPFQVHFSVTDRNAHEVRSMIDFTRAAGAHVLNIFFLVCTGRGESMSDISPARYEAVLNELVEAQANTPELLIRARCAPHFKRVAYERDPDSPLTRAQGYEGGGCLAGIHYCRITPEGAVTACPYIPDEQGNIRQESFWRIWDHAPQMQSLRQPTLTGKCGKCEYRKLCGGCRARPLGIARAAEPIALPSDATEYHLLTTERLGHGEALMRADPWCGHYPTGKPLIEPLNESGPTTISWSPEAEQRLARVPGFLRKMVRKRAEAHAVEQGESQVTVAHMSALAAKRFGDNMPARPTASGDQATPGNQASGEIPPESPVRRLAWTAEATEYLQQTPTFLREGVFAVAEDVARQEGRLEVNINLLRRLEAEDDPARKLFWEDQAEELLEVVLAGRAPQVALFVRPSMEAAAEREAKRRDSIVVSEADVAVVIATDMAGVEWDADALARVESAPDFVRGGIKKAAEFGARREGLSRITAEDLTRFRNRAMMRAVRRMKGFGMADLDFDAFAIARERVPRLKGNEQAVKRFQQIRSYVESKQAPDGGGLGLLDRDLLERMRAELRR
ncbi:radical SAM/SPASM domain-containing protein [Sedimenticola hydrogenitrophicus]|uniref:radical SAM/SPASM domain-containing protein n=1 Tax=Sedimenticola hydrogenitrophicus TaxID=2967975 RepID=UPI0023AEFF93|nr:radical SAM protein [Sedimenticola hydrogenitrophicus]